MTTTPNAVRVIANAGTAAVRRTLMAFSAAGVLLAGNPAFAATVAQLASPTELSATKTTIQFDNLQDGNAVNSAYSSQGILFSRDDGHAIAALDWVSLGRTTSSSRNVLATVSGTIDGDIVSNWTTHLNVLLSQPAFELGAMFGNDQDAGAFTGIKLSVFDGNDGLLGSITVPTNSNTNVDQFIGLRSDVPFARARFENVGIINGYAVVLDDVAFSAAAVPTPAAAWLIAPAMGLLAPWARRRTQS